MKANTLFVTTAGAALTGPAFAGVLHGATSGTGYTVHRDHAAQGRRADAQASESRTHGRQGSTKLGAAAGGRHTDALRAKQTRAEVEAELLRAQKHPTWNARRLGAPVSME